MNISQRAGHAGSVGLNISPRARWVVCPLGTRGDIQAVTRGSSSGGRRGGRRGLRGRPSSHVTMLAQGRVQTRISSGSGVDRYHDNFFKTARTKGEVPSAFPPFAPVESVLVAKVSIGERRVSQLSTRCLSHRVAQAQSVTDRVTMQAGCGQGPGLPPWLRVRAVLSTVTGSDKPEAESRPPVSRVPSPSQCRAGYGVHRAEPHAGRT